MKKNLLFLIGILLGAISIQAANVGDYIYSPTAKFKVAGSNLFTNGDFSQGFNGWTNEDGASVDVGVWSVLSGAGPNGQYHNVALSLAASTEEGTLLSYMLSLSPGLYTISYWVKAESSTQLAVQQGSDNYAHFFLSEDGSGNDSTAVSSCSSISTEWTQIITSVEVTRDKPFLVFNASNVSADIMFTGFEVYPVTEVFDTRKSDLLLEYVNKLRNDANLPKGRSDFVDAIFECSARLSDPQYLENEDAMEEVMDAMKEFIAEFLKANSGDTDSGDWATRTFSSNWNRFNGTDNSIVGSYAAIGGRWGFSANDGSLERPAGDGYVLSAGIQRGYDLKKDDDGGSLGVMVTRNDLAPGRYMFKIEAQAVAAANRAQPYGSNNYLPIVGPSIFIGSDTVKFDKDTLYNGRWKTLYYIADVKQGETVEAGFLFPFYSDLRGGRYSLRNPEFRIVGVDSDQQELENAAARLVAARNDLKQIVDSFSIELAGYLWRRVEQNGYSFDLDESLADGQRLYDDSFTWVNSTGKPTSSATISDINAISKEMISHTSSLKTVRALVIESNAVIAELQTWIRKGTMALNDGAYAQVPASRRSDLQEAVSVGQQLMDAISSTDQEDEFLYAIKAIKEARLSYQASVASRSLPAEVAIQNGGFESWTHDNNYPSTNAYGYGWEFYGGKDFNRWQIRTGDENYESGKKFCIWRGTTVAPEAKMKQAIVLTEPGLYEYRVKAYATDDYVNELLGVAKVMTIFDLVTLESATVDTIYRPNVRVFFGPDGATNDSLAVSKCIAPGASGEGVPTRSYKGINGYTPWTYSIFYNKTNPYEEEVEFGIESYDNNASAGVNAFGFGDNQVYYLGDATQYVADTKAALEQQIERAKSLIAANTERKDLEWLFWKLRRYLYDGSYSFDNYPAPAMPTDAQGLQNAYISLREIMGIIDTTSVKNDEGIDSEDPNATTVFYDFEDGQTPFVARSRIAVGVGYDEKRASNVATFTANSNAQNGYSFANYDFSSLVEQKTDVTLDFDYYNTSGSRSMLTIGDASVRGTTGGSARGTYGSTGAIFRIGSDKNNFYINDETYELTDYCDQWLHITVKVNLLNKTAEYTVKDAAGNNLQTAVSGGYWQQDAQTCSQIDVFGWINNSNVGMIDNLKITASVADGVQFADYTVRYVNEDGTDIKTAVTRNARVGATIELIDSDKEAIRTEDGTKKYIFKEDNTSTTPIAQSGTEIRVVFREAQKYNWVLNCYIEGTSTRLAQETNEAPLFEGDTYTYYCKIGYKYGDDYYMVDPTYYNGYLYTFDAANVNSGGYVVGTVYYHKVDSIAYFSEIEDLALVGTVQTWIGWSDLFEPGTRFQRYSGGAAPRLMEGSYFYTAPLVGGKYNVTFYGRNGNTNSAEAPALYVRDAEGSLTNTGIQVPGWGSAVTGSVFVEGVKIPEGCSLAIMNDGNANNLDLDVITMVLTERDTPEQLVCATPTFTLDGNVLTISTSTQDATVYYTTDGSAPTTSSTRYTGPITLTRNCTVKAFAVAAGHENSAVASYTVDWFKVDAVRITFANGYITMSTITEGAQIYYTLDGSNPTTQSLRYYGTPVAASQNGTVKAFATLDGYHDSDVSSYDITSLTVAVPQFALDDSRTQLTIACGTSGAQVYYAFEDGDWQNYTGAITLTDNRSVRAYAHRDGYNDSGIETYTPDWFACEQVQITLDELTVRLSTPTAGATIRYTLDGTEPTGTSAVYSQPIVLNSIVAVKAYAEKQWMNNSAVTTYELPAWMAAVFAAGGFDAVTELAVTGTWNAADFSYLHSMPALRHLNMSGATLPDATLPDGAFANLPIVSVELPEAITTVGSNLFTGCTALAAIVWNSNTALTAAAVNGLTNPNLLLYVNRRNLAPDGIENLVIGDLPATITLTDSDGPANFYCPRSFEAASISYTRNFTLESAKNGGTAGWESLSLPFRVQTVTHEENGTLVPFGSFTDSETTKPFWLYKMQENGVLFMPATVIEANTPYIISMPNHESYADDYNQRGNVTFAAKNVTVAKTQLTTIRREAMGLTMVPCYELTPQAQGVFTLNKDVYRMGSREEAPGSVFVENLRDVRPFEAYIQSWQSQPSRVIRLIDNLPTGDVQQTTGILGVYSQREGFGSQHDVYDLQGRKVAIERMANGRLPKGVYIINGRKTVVR